MEIKSLKDIPHAKVLENTEGCVLSWDLGMSSQFEVVCRSKNPRQVEILEKLLSQGHEQAVLQMDHAYPVL
jgi:hypothetical protein